MGSFALAIVWAVIAAVVQADVATRLAQNPGIHRAIHLRDSQTNSLVAFSFKASDDVAVFEEQIHKAFGGSEADMNIAQVAMEARIPSNAEWCQAKLNLYTREICELHEEKCNLLKKVAHESDSVIEIVSVEGEISSWAFASSVSSASPVTSLRIRDLDHLDVDSEELKWQQRLYWLSVYCGLRFFPQQTSDPVGALSNLGGADLLFFSFEVTKSLSLFKTLLEVEQRVRKHIIIDVKSGENKSVQTWLALGSQSTQESFLEEEILLFCKHNPAWEIAEREKQGLFWLRRKETHQLASSFLPPRIWAGVQTPSGEKTFVDVQGGETLREAVVRVGDILSLSPDNLALLSQHLRAMERSALESDIAAAKENIQEMEKTLARIDDPTDGELDMRLLDSFSRTSRSLSLSLRRAHQQTHHLASVLLSRIHHYDALLSKHLPKSSSAVAEVVYSILSSSSVSFTSILQNEDELNASIRSLHRLGLLTHPHRVKSWDMQVMVEAVMHVLSPLDHPAIFNMGAGSGDNLLLNLARLGYKKLYACELIESRNIHLHARDTHVATSEQDMQQTNYASDIFSAVMSVSVIEHDVDIARYMREANRLLKNGGILLTSCDYWPEKLDTSSVPLELNVFSREELTSLAGEETLSRFGFKLVVNERTSWDANKTMIHFFGKRYTFAMLTMVKFHSLTRVLYTTPISTTIEASVSEHSEEYEKIRNKYPDAQIFGMSAHNPMYLPRGIYKFFDHITWVKQNNSFASTQKHLETHFAIDIIV